jgi:tripartite ATP-independent transporter DctP family solute receptor
MIRSIRTFAVTALVLLLTAGMAQEITLRAADNQPEDYPTVQGLYFMADYIEAATDGRIVMEVFPGGQLGDERSTIEQVQLGVIDVVRTSTSPVGEFYEPMGVYSLPYIFRSETHMWKVVNGPIGRELLDGLREADMVGLAYYDSGSRNFYTTDTPIREAADLEGLRIRTQQSQVVLDMMEALGAEPVPMAFEEVYSSLQTGVIDGAENNFPSYGPFGVRHYEVAPYFTLDGHARVPEVVMISQSTWDDLSAEDQQIVREAALASIPVQAALWDELSNESREAVVEAGSEIISVDVSEFQAAMDPLYEEYGAAFGDLVDRILAVE